MFLQPLLDLQSRYILHVLTSRLLALETMQAGLYRDGLFLLVRSSSAFKPLCIALMYVSTYSLSGRPALCVSALQGHRKQFLLLFEPRRMRPAGWRIVGNVCKNGPLKQQNSFSSSLS